MHKLLHKGISVSRHHLKGVYTCSVGSKSGGERPDGHPCEVMCTIREGDCTLEEATSGGHGSLPVPISLSIKGSQATLRPWDPSTCVIAAGICNDLVHLPIQPGRWIFAVDCSLLTLSHIADIVGSKGRLIGVWDDSYQDLPSQAERATFLKMYRNVVLLTADVKNASLEYYESMLSLSMSARHNILMTLHPRVGANSPFRLFQQAEEPAAIFRHIFGFLECGDMARVKCVVFCHWPADTRPEAIRDIMVKHTDIMQRWRIPQSEANVTTKHEGEGSGEEGLSPAGGQEEDGGTAVDMPEARQGSKEKKSEQEAVPQWVLLGIPLGNIATDGQRQDACNMLVKVIGVMKRLQNGHRTGLQAKEQLRLVPHFPRHALLLLKYAPQREGEKSSKSSKEVQQPKHDAVPMPAFGKTAAAVPPGLTQMSAGSELPRSSGQAASSTVPLEIAPPPGHIAGASADISEPMHVVPRPTPTPKKDASALPGSVTNSRMPAKEMQPKNQPRSTALTPTPAPGLSLATDQAVVRAVPRQRTAAAGQQAAACASSTTPPFTAGSESASANTWQQLVQQQQQQQHLPSELDMLAALRSKQQQAEPKPKLGQHLGSGDWRREVVLQQQQEQEQLALAARAAGLAYDHQYDGFDTEQLPAHWRGRGNTALSPEEVLLGKGHHSWNSSSVSITGTSLPPEHARGRGKGAGTRSVGLGLDVEFGLGLTALGLDLADAGDLASAGSRAGPRPAHAGANGLGQGLGLGPAGLGSGSTSGLGLGMGLGGLGGAGSGTGAGAGAGAGAGGPRNRGGLAGTGHGGLGGAGVAGGLRNSVGGLSELGLGSSGLAGVDDLLGAPGGPMGTGGLVGTGGPAAARPRGVSTGSALAGTIEPPPGLAALSASRPPPVWSPSLLRAVEAGRGGCELETLEGSGLEIPSLNSRFWAQAAYLEQQQLQLQQQQQQYQQLHPRNPWVQR